MKRGSLSIIIPTLGRPSLKRTLSSIEPQLAPQDEVLVISDGPRPWTRAMVMPFGKSFRFLETVSAASDYGCSPRNLGMQSATGDYLAFMDDDDVYLEGAFAAMRAAMDAHYEKLFIFRMKHQGSILWAEPELRLNNISTQMFCFPNREGRLGRWRMNPETESGRGDDYLFARDTAARWPKDSVLFRDEVIADLTRHTYGVLDLQGADPAWSGKAEP